MERTRFGELAVAAGYLTPAQVETALEIQRRDARTGEIPRPIGIICMQLGFLSFKEMMITLDRIDRRVQGGPRVRTVRAQSAQERGRRKATPLVRRRLVTAE